MLAVLFVLIGLAISALGRSFGLTSDEVRDVASVFLLVGSVDTAIVWFWDKLFPLRH
jgi:hypothetical protein